MRTAWFPLFCTIGCLAADQSNVPTVSDSLGIALIEYPTSFEATSDRSWFADSVPLLTIGEPTPDLYRVQTALFQSDGRVVVTNGGTQELLFFDRAGQLRARSGGEGEGPGEFFQITSLSFGAADSLFVFDGRKRKVSVFDQNGVFARSVSLRGLDTLGFAEYVGVLHSGNIVGAFRRQTNGLGLVRDSLGIMTFSQSGEPTSLIAVFPHTYTHWGPHFLPGAETAAFPVPVPFSGLAEVGVGDSGIYVAVPEPYSVILLDRSAMRRVTRQQAPSGPVTDAHRERLLAALGGGRLNPHELGVLFDLAGPPRLPAFGVGPLTAKVGEQHLLVTDEGGVWLRPYQLPGDTASQAWPRFDSEGIYEGTATMPLGFRPTAVREDVVLGVFQDEMDVESVRAYRLVVER